MRLLLVLAVQAAVQLASESDCNPTPMCSGSHLPQRRKQWQQQQQHCSPHLSMWSAREGQAAQVGLSALLKTPPAVQQHSPGQCQFPWQLCARLPTLSSNQDLRST